MIQHYLLQQILQQYVAQKLFHIKMTHKGDHMPPNLLHLEPLYSLFVASPLVVVATNFFKTCIVQDLCHNPSLGLATKARASKGASQERSPGVTCHAFRSVGKCEGMNSHTPK